MPSLGPTSRRRRRFCAALFVLFGLALPACAFWDLDDWSAHSGNPLTVDGGYADAADAGMGTAADSGEGSYCSTLDAGALFCDDFDTDANPWSVHVTCPHCSASVAPPDAGMAPSPPDVFSVYSPAGDPDPSAYRQVTLIGTYSDITSDFWAYVSTADDDGQPALEQLVYYVDGANYLRVRIYVNGATATLGTSVTATMLPSTNYSIVATWPFPQNMWHHVNFTFSTLDNVHRISWTVDGTVVVPNTTDIVDGTSVPGYAGRVDLQAGVFYVGVDPTNGVTRFTLDNVVLTSP